MPVKVEFKGGAKRSARMPAYHCVPGVGLRRLALRFQLGEGVYGEGNWKKSLRRAEHARPFLRDVYNHLQEHAMKMIDGVDGVDGADDHLAAMQWACVVLMYAEERFGKRWLEI